MLTYQLNPAVQLSVSEGPDNQYVCCIDFGKSRKCYQIDHKVACIIQYCAEPRTEEEIKQFSIKQASIHASQFDEFFSAFLLQRAILKNTADKSVTTIGSNLLKFKLKLLPAAAANQLAKPLLLLIKKPIAILLMLAFMTSLLHILLSVNSGEFSTLSAAFTWKESITVVFLIAAGLIFHELGHATAAFYYGCRRVDIGIGWYIYFIVFYAELSESWQLKPEKRLLIDSAGGYFQSVFGVALWLIYLLTEQYVFLHTAAMLALYSAFNLNPFFRMDGYWIASDFFKITNLRDTAFSFIRNAFTEPGYFWRNLKRSRHDRLVRITIIYSTSMFIFYLLFGYFVYMHLFPNSIRYLHDISITMLTNSASGAYFALSLIQIIWNFLIVYFVVYFSFSMYKKASDFMKTKYYSTRSSYPKA
jgi:putative peptide zinc metalloprotease protein